MMAGVGEFAGRMHQDLIDAIDWAIDQGANDPRVQQNQSDCRVAALEAAGKQIDYAVIGDEGHGFQHWKNRLTQFRKTEDFLATCLGGRSSGFDVYQLGSWAF